MFKLAMALSPLETLLYIYAHPQTKKPVGNILIHFSHFEKKYKV